MWTAHGDENVHLGATILSGRTHISIHKCALVCTKVRDAGWLLFTLTAVWGSASICFFSEDTAKHSRESPTPDNLCNYHAEATILRIIAVQRQHTRQNFRKGHRTSVSVTLLSADTQYRCQLHTTPSMTKQLTSMLTLRADKVHSHFSVAEI